MENEQQIYEQQADVAQDQQIDTHQAQIDYN